MMMLILQAHPQYIQTTIKSMKIGLDPKVTLPQVLLSKIDKQTSMIQNLVSRIQSHRKMLFSESSLFNFHSQISNVQSKSDLFNSDNQKQESKLKSFIKMGKFNGVNGQDKRLERKSTASTNGKHQFEIQSKGKACKKIVFSLQKSRFHKKSHNEKQIQINPQVGNNFQSKFFQTAASSPRKSMDSYSYKAELVSTKDEIPKISRIKSNLLLVVEGLNVKALFNILNSQKNYPQYRSEPDELYYFFIQMSKKLQIDSYFKEPIIKKYRNCVYFGQKTTQNNSYVGFVWYFRKALYLGQFLNGKKNGFGIQTDIQTTNKTTIFSGNFENGKKTGYFKVLTEKYEYNGILLNGKFHGQGELETKNISIYGGHFHCGQKHGYGVEEFKDGQKYKGEYAHSKFQGFGELSTRQYYYKGEFVNGRAHGQGFERVDKYQFDGGFKNGKKDGKGMIRFNNGEFYQGNFENGSISNVKFNQTDQIKPNQTNEKKKPLLFQPSSILFQQREQKNPVQSRKQKTNRNMIMQKYASRQFPSLFEQNENQQVTIISNRNSRKILSKNKNSTENTWYQSQFQKNNSKVQYYDISLHNINDPEDQSLSVKHYD